MNLIDSLNANARKFAGEAALTEIDYLTPEKKGSGGFIRRELSWDEFLKFSNRFANLLSHSGFGGKCKIAILMFNSIEWLPIYFGILKSGNIAVPLNFRYTPEEIKYCLKKADCSALIFGSEFSGAVSSIYEEMPFIKEMYFIGENCPDFAKELNKLLPEQSEYYKEPEIGENDDAAIYFSSGTTGFPKAILHPHSSLYHTAIAETKHHGQTHDDIFLCIPPLYHTGAKMHWFGSLITGGKAVLLKGIKPSHIIETISNEKCSIVWLLVPWAQDILDAFESGELNKNDYDLSSWRLMHIGAQPVPPALIKRWLMHFPNQQYDTNYGLSESCGPGCLHLGTENINKVGSIGKAGFGWQIRIENKKGDPAPRGEKGELCIKGPAVMKCYYNDPDATAEVLKDGWLHTGDIAREDEDGFIYLVDRKKDMIISGGENIYPVQIENFLRSHDAIKDAAVVGYPDERLGETVFAVIEPKNDHSLSESEIFEYCLGLPRYIRPRRIVFDDIPRNPTGKIEKTKLRAKYCKKNKAVLYIHGQGGNADEKNHYISLFPDHDIIGLDYASEDPMQAEAEFPKLFDKLCGNYERVILIANSIGAYFAMLTLADKNIAKAYFISPIADMEKLISDMMRMANVSEKELCEKREIKTDLGQVLSYEYLLYARNHPISWNIPSNIIYGKNDDLTSPEAISELAKKINAGLYIMEKGEHWFHTPEQMRFIDEAIKNTL